MALQLGKPTRTFALAELACPCASTSPTSPMTMLVEVWACMPSAATLCVASSRSLELMTLPRDWASLTNCRLEHPQRATRHAWPTQAGHLGLFAWLRCA